MPEQTHNVRITAAATSLVTSLALVTPLAKSAATAAEIEPVWAPATTLSAPAVHASYPVLAATGETTVVTWQGPSDRNGVNQAIMVRRRVADQAWEPEHRIGRGTEPRAATNRSGLSVVIWRNNLKTFEPGHVFVATGTPEGTWSSPVKLPTDTGDRYANNWSTAVSDSGAAVAWWLENTFAHNGPVGATLRVAYRAPDGIWGKPVDAAGLQRNILADVTIGPRGNVLVAYAVRSGVYVRSRVVGQGWLRPRLLVSRDGLPDGDLSVVTSPRGDVAVVAWQHGYTAPLRARRRDAGQWEPVARLTQGPPPDPWSWDLAVDRAADTTIAWDRADQSVAAAVWPRGAAVGSPQMLASPPAGNLTTTDAVTVATNRAGDEVIAWLRDDRGPGRLQASYRPSGQSWGPVQRVNPAEDDVWDFEATVRPDGVVDAVWSDWEDGPVITRLRFSYFSVP